MMPKPHDEHAAPGCTAGSEDFEDLEGMLRGLPREEPGADFAAKVMERVAALPAHKAPASPASTDARGARLRREGPLVRAARWLCRPRTFSLSPLQAAAAALCLVLAAGLALRHGTGPTTALKQGLVPVHFVLAAPGAQSVAVIGDFNGWNGRGWEMRRDKAGMWVLSASLAPGSHEYVFQIDGRATRPDPAASFSKDDGFGGVNSVLLVRGGNGKAI
ncbi:glycoside hydrolase family 13 domain protein [Desulfovibrio sp. X2]|uniref:glycogen-binding domain-containing protein n=1 Tax=Desulfovibrio sp. X2 TaxID=941449 RepID=UPI000358C6E1|nr:glycogen-binding domain-containing protein [Desulfovibrio sp. X2]EPR41239.1 glycoside hydrolase family 13 domain protein [Desulfovibrio sp. X2]